MRYMLIESMGLGLINPLLLFLFSVVCTMTTEGLREGKIVPGCTKYPPQANLLTTSPCS